MCTEAIKQCHCLRYTTNCHMHGCEGTAHVFFLGTETGENRQPKELLSHLRPRKTRSRLELYTLLGIGDSAVSSKWKTNRRQIYIFQSINHERGRSAEDTCLTWSIVFLINFDEPRINGSWLCVFQTSYSLSIFLNTPCRATNQDEKLHIYVDFFRRDGLYFLSQTTMVKVSLYGCEGTRQISAA